MEIIFSTDKNKLNMEVIINFLHKHSYWAKNRPVEKIKKSILNSMCIGMYTEEKQQIGFTRIVTDFATVYYLADFFIIPEQQNKGLGKKFMKYIDGLDELKGLRGILTTQTAHSFYEKYGFSRENDIVQKRMMVKGQ